MCGYVLERKSSADLLTSISDGRYLSQKWRMLHCGLPHRLYLVELEGDYSLRPSNKQVRGVHAAVCCGWLGAGQFCAAGRDDSILLHLNGC